LSIKQTGFVAADWMQLAEVSVMVDFGVLLPETWLITSNVLECNKLTLVSELFHIAVAIHSSVFMHFTLAVNIG